MQSPASKDPFMILVAPTHKLEAPYHELTSCIFDKKTFNFAEAFSENA